MKKPGYQQTTVGWIPDDWRVKHFDDVSNIDELSLPGNTRDDYEFQYISLSDVDSEVFSIETQKTTFANAPSRARRIVRKGDVLMSTVRPNLQGFSIIRQEVSDLIASTGFAVITAHACHNEYLYYYLFGDAVNRQLFQLLVGSNYPAINSSDVRRLRIPLPPLPEQRRIGAILSTWDTAIAKEQQLINALQNRHRALMQQLLSGKKRLKGFKGEWKKVKAKEIFWNSSNKQNGDEPLLSSTQERGIIPRDMLEGRVTMPSSETSSYKLVEPGDFVISLRSFQGGLEYSGYRGIVSPAYTILKSSESLDKRFYRFYFKSTEFISRLSVAVIGIRDGKQISYEDFCGIRIPFPSLEEQSSIATILSTSEKEIQTHRRRLAALQQQKKGLMQVLLTGKVRVKTKE